MSRLGMPGRHLRSLLGWLLVAALAVVVVPRLPVVVVGLVAWWAVTVVLWRRRSSGRVHPPGRLRSPGPNGSLGARSPARS